MSFTDPYRKHHTELLDLTGQITRTFDATALQKDASQAFYLLSTLAGKLNVHLTMEDKALYPRLLSSNKEEVVQTTRQYIEEMGGIKIALGSFIEKWGNQTQIQSNPEDFISETTGLFEVLAARIEKENAVLFPMADEV